MYYELSATATLVSACPLHSLPASDLSLRCARHVAAWLGVGLEATVEDSAVFCKFQRSTILPDALSLLCYYLERVSSPYTSRRACCLFLSSLLSLFALGSVFFAPFHSVSFLHAAVARWAVLATMRSQCPLAATSLALMLSAICSHFLSKPNDA